MSCQVEQGCQTGRNTRVNSCGVFTQCLRTGSRILCYTPVGNIYLMVTNSPFVASSSLLCTVQLKSKYRECQKQTKMSESDFLELGS